MFGQSCFHLFILGRPHQKATILLSFGQSCFMECLVCNDLCHRIHLHNIMKLIQSWAFRVSIILLLCLNFLYGLFKYVNAASMFSVLCYSYRMNDFFWMRNVCFDVNVVHRKFDIHVEKGIFISN